MPRVTFIPNGVTFAAVSTNNGAVDGVVVGNLLYVCGNFTQVSDAAGTYARGSIACLNLSTARWTAFDGGADAGFVTSVTSDGTYLYAVTGTARRTFSGLTGSRWFVRYALATGVIEDWDIVGTTPSGSPEYNSVRHIGGSVYVAGVNPQFTNGSVTRKVAKITSGSLSSWVLAGNFGNSLDDFGLVEGLAEVSANVLGLWGDGVQVYANIGKSQYAAYGYVTASALTGTVSTSTNGYITTFASQNSAQDAGVLYLPVRDGTSVRDLPANTVNGSSRTGTYAVTPASGAWNTAWNYAITTGSLLALAVSGGNVFVGGSRANTPVFGLYTPAGVAVGSFATTYDPPGATQATFRALIVYGSWLIVLGTTNGSTLNGRAVVGLNVFSASTGDPI